MHSHIPCLDKSEDNALKGFLYTQEPESQSSRSTKWNAFNNYYGYKVAKTPKFGTLELCQSYSLRGKSYFE